MILVQGCRVEALNSVQLLNLFNCGLFIKIVFHMSLSKGKLFVNIVRYKFLLVFCIFYRFLIDFQEVYTQPHYSVWDVLFSYIPKKMLHWCCIYLSVRELQVVLQHLTEGSIFSRVAEQRRYLFWFVFVQLKAFLENPEAFASLAPATDAAAAAAPAEEAKEEKKEEEEEDESDDDMGFGLFD